MLGVDSEGEAARSKFTEKRLDEERLKRNQERMREKQFHHEEKQLERQKIRDKYLLKSNKNPSVSKTEPAPESTNKTCLIS